MSGFFIACEKLAGFFLGGLDREMPIPDFFGVHVDEIKTILTLLTDAIKLIEAVWKLVKFIKKSSRQK